MQDVIFEFYIGDTYQRDFTIGGYTSDIDEVYFTVKKTQADRKPLIQKTLDNGITLVDIVYTEEGSILERTYNLLVNASDTDNLTPGTEYVFDIEIVTETEAEPIKKTIITGTVVLNDATTRVYNEHSGNEA